VVLIEESHANVLNVLCEYACYLIKHNLSM